MTREEFKNTRFGNGDMVVYDDEEFYVVSVDFSEDLIEIRWTDVCTTWVRCENCEMVVK